jgi:CRISPR-associated protein Csb2
MALVAAHFETGGSDEEKQSERCALDWLAELPSPRIRCIEISERTPVDCYVPVNDAVQPTQSMLQSAPGMPRSRQKRTFPTVIPLRIEDGEDSDGDVIFEWQQVSDLSVHLPALERLCANVIRVGHSSSLVMAWTDIRSKAICADWWEPTNSRAEMTCRVAGPGELQRLAAAFQADRIEAFAELKAEIDSTKGKPQKAAKERFEQLFGEPYKASLRIPDPIPATLGMWQGYCRSHPIVAEPVQENQYFERDLLILAKMEGPSLNVERTLALTQALRFALMAKQGKVAMPSWLSGHEADGSPTTAPHAAFLALPFVGHRHADGHLLGLAIAIPKGVTVAERGRWLGPLLVNPNTGEATEAHLTPMVKLWSTDLPDWTLQLEERPSPPQTLQNATWTRPATTWASVTPVVLDRYPKASRNTDRQAWHAEVAETVSLACTRSGLPIPSEVDVDSTSWHEGAPRAWAKTRRMQNGDSTQTAPLGDGFPSFPTKQSRSPRVQVHVWLRFSQPVAGPVIIGAGRFFGYGLCKPLLQRGE